jgi:hypothetical protein
MTTITPLATPAGASQALGAKPSDDNLPGRQAQRLQQEDRLLQINQLKGIGVTQSKSLDKTI